MINFVNTGADEAILKSMSTEGCSEDLIKAMNKQGLVQKDVTVQGKNGKTFTRKQWVKSGDTTSTDSQTTSNDNSGGDSMKQWHDKVQNGNFTSEQKKELDYGVSQRHACILQKDGKIKTAKTWDEAEYAESKGWKNLGSLTGILNEGRLPNEGLSSDKGLFSTVHHGGYTIKHSSSNGTWSIYDAHGELEDSGFKTADAAKKQIDEDAKIAKPKSGIVFSKVSDGNAKKAITDMLSAGHSRQDIMSSAKAAGITWTESSHEGINWMRASMAIQKHLTESSAGDASNSKTGSTEPTKSTKNNDFVKTSGLKSNEVCDNIIETCDDLYGDGFVFLDRKEQDEVIQKVADNFGVNSKDIDKMLRSGLDAGGYLLTRNGAELSDEKVFEAVHDYISDLTVQEIDDIDEVVDHIRENYTDYFPLTSKTLKSIKSAVKKILR